MNKKTASRPRTADALLAMPADSYMDATQLEFFRQLLLEQRQQLHDNAVETGEHLRDDSELASDPSDRATQEEEHSIELRVRDRERKMLTKIDAALARINDGTYGWCVESGEPIGLPRLLARPTAALSLEAQERREQAQKRQGD